MKGFGVTFFDKFLSFSPNQRPVTYYNDCPVINTKSRLTYKKTNYEKINSTCINYF